jgi:hypothetical protein
MMRHFILYKHEGYYSKAKVLNRLPDGRLAVILFSIPYAAHYGGDTIDDSVILVSDDEGESWQRTENDPSVPFTWPAKNVSERYGRFCGVMPDDTYLAAGTTGYEVWEASRREEAEQEGFTVKPHPSGDPDRVIVYSPKLFVQRSRDQGKTWERREWRVPGTISIHAFPTSTILSDGTVLIPLHGVDNLDFRKSHARNYAFRLWDNGENSRLIVMASDVSGLIGSETALLEVSPIGFPIQRVTCWRAGQMMEVGPGLIP